MSTNITRSPETKAIALVSGDLAPLLQPAIPLLNENIDNLTTLGSLPIGAHLILRCRKDWRDATIVAASTDRVTLSVGAPSGRTYRVRRPPDSTLYFDGAIPILGAGGWRAGLARYDIRW